MPIKVQGGKEYNLVSERLVKLRELYADADISTEVEIHGDNALIKAKIHTYQNAERTGQPNHSTGHALVSLSGDKALEKGETTAVGRALAFLHQDLMGSEIASADEMQDFHADKVRKEMLQQYRAYGLALQRNWESCTAIRQYLDDGELPAAWEAWIEIDEDDRQALRVASTKGGWLTVEQSKRLGEASNQDFDTERGVYRSIADKEVA